MGDKTMRMKKKIGILTWYNHGNFGSALQTYAFQTYLNRLGFKVEVIAYEMQWCRINKSRIKQIKSAIKKKLATLAEILPIVPSRFRNSFQFFYKKYIDFSRSCTESNISEIANKYDVLISGSDQIWSPVYIDYTYLLNFCSSKNFCKISYASSFGQYDIAEDKVEEYKRLLADYNSISVREQSGADILKKLGFSAEIVADPTLLLDADDYRKIERSVEGIPDKFIFCYLLSSEGKYREVVCNYAKDNNLPIIGFSSQHQDYDWMLNVGEIGPCEFLWCIDHSELTITNSYHGTILSMILNTPFFTYKRFRADDPICQNSRIEQLQKEFNIGNYVLDYGMPIPHNIKPYHNQEFNERLERLRIVSANYLKKSITNS